MTRVNNFTDRLLTVLTVLAVPVLGVGLWRIGSSGLDQINQYRARRGIAAIVDSLISAPNARVSMLGKRAGRTFVEVVDYQCPFCRQADSLLHARSSTSDDLRIVTLQLPLKAIHPLAEPAAIAAVCAGRQQAFASFHRSLYKQGIPASAALMWRLAQQSGAQDSIAFASCLTANDARRVVELEAATATALGARGTPTFFDSRGNPASLDQVLAGDRPSREQK